MLVTEDGTLDSKSFRAIGTTPPPAVQAWMGASAGSWRIQSKPVMKGLPVKARVAITLTISAQ